MSTTLSPPVKLAYGVWRYDWTGTAPFRVFDYGTYSFQIEATDETSYFVTSDNNIEPPPIEVFDSTETASVAVGETYPASIVIQWRGYSYADYYDVQKEVSPSTFETVYREPETGAGYYRYISQKEMEDVETVTYRVIVYDKSGESVNVDTTQIVIRNPSPPELTYTYNAGTGLLTIAAA